MDRGSTKPQSKRISSINENLSEKDCGLLLMNPNASENDTSPLPRRSNSLLSADSRERIAAGKGVKPRSKSPSFFKMLVGGLRKFSTQDDDASKAEPTSLSDNEELTFSSPHEKEFEERQRIEHIATLPRNKDIWKKQNSEEVAKFVLADSYPTEENKRTEEEGDTTYESVPDKSVSPNSSNNTSDSPILHETEHHSFGMDALEMLHNQLRLLVRQDCDEDMADKMQDKVIETLQKQISDLQQSLECLQQSDQSLRLSLKMAEMRAQEAEIKLHHSNDRSLKLERDCRWLETEFKILYQKYHEMQKHLQKKAVLHQISLEQRSPTKLRRPNSVQSRHQRSMTFDSVQVSPVKRHNSSEVIYQHQQQQLVAQQQKQTQSHPNSNNHHKNHVHINPSSSLPRLHSGSLSHTETRV